MPATRKRKKASRTLVPITQSTTATTATKRERKKERKKGEEARQPASQRAKEHLLRLLPASERRSIFFVFCPRACPKDKW
jgi:hypothetical protein